MLLDDDYTPPAPRTAPTELGLGDITDPNLWLRAWRQAFAAEARIPEEQRAKRADAYVRAIRRVLTPALDRLRTRRTDAAPARSFFLLPPPPNFSPRLSPQPRIDTAMGKKFDTSQMTERELEQLNQRKNELRYTGMSDKQIAKHLRKQDKAARKDAAARADAAAQRPAPAFTMPSYTPPAPRADGRSDEEIAADNMRRRSESQWMTRGNADQLRGSGS